MYHSLTMLWNALNPSQCISSRDRTLIIHYLFFIQVSVYQLLDISKNNNTQEKKLLSSRLIPVHSTGWEVFTITQAVSIYTPLRPSITCTDFSLQTCLSYELYLTNVNFFIKVRSWMSDERSNLGLHVVVQTLGGSQMDLKLIRFASGRNHHQSKQPMLVLFTDDGSRSTTLENTGEFRSS